MNIYKQTPYFYIIQDIRNGIINAGAKWGKDSNPSNFMKEDGYKTSSGTILKIIESHGTETFVIRKLKTFSSVHQTVDYETRFLKKVKARTNRNFYNRHENDFIFDSEKRKFVVEILHGNGITNISQTEYWKKSTKKNHARIISKRRKTIEENWDEEFRQELKSKKQKSWKVSPKLETHREKTRLRRLKEESNKTDLEKQQFSDLMKNIYWSRTEEEINLHKKKHSISGKKSYENNPELRKLRSESSKGLISINKDGINKRVKPDKVVEYYRDGWVDGCIQVRKRTKSSCAGKKAVNKGGIAKYIPKEDVEIYLRNGWGLGLK